MILEEWDPVLDEAVDEAAAEVTGKAEEVKRCGKRCSEDCMHCVEERCDEEEGELERLGDAAEDSRDRCRDQERCDLLAFLRLSAEVHGKGSARQSEDLGHAVEGEAAFREHFFQGMCARGKIIEMLEPVSLDTAIADGRAEDERQVDEVMQACRQEDAFGEGVAPYADDAARLEEELELLNGVLDSRPYEAEEQGHRNHDGEADGYDKGRALEDAEPVRDLGIIEVVVNPRGAAGDEDGAEHAHVECLDVRDHREARACASCLAVIHSEEAAVQRQERGDEVVEAHVDDEGLHCAARRFLFREADWHGDGEEDWHLGEYRPGTLFDDEPEIIPDGAFICDAAEKHRVLADNRDGNRETEECEQDDRRVHCAAKPLQFLHDAIFLDRHVHTPYFLT